MKRHQTALLVILLGLVGLIALGRAYQYLHDKGILYPVGPSDFQERGDFAINNRTILSDLSAGRSAVFVPAAPTPDLIATPQPAVAISWKQSDFFAVAEALHRQVWGTGLEGWRVYGLVLATGCSNDPSGFDSGDITLFRDARHEGYVVHELDIYPSGGGVTWGSAMFLRPLLGWAGVDVDAMKVPAEAALSIAELHGGRDFRARVQNACEIRVALKPTPSGDRAWNVYYVRHGGPGHFVIRVDPSLGWYWPVPGE